MIGIQIRVEDEEEDNVESNPKVLSMVGFKGAKVALNTLHIFLQQQHTNIMLLI